MIFRLNLPKKGISVLKEKSEHHQGILHIQIRLGTKYQLIELTILIFLDQKEYFRSKIEKVNITTETCMSKLGKVLNFSLKQNF